jgi:glycosyltransferase involved in cell wall biosynthesis
MEVIRNLCWQLSGGCQAALEEIAMSVAVMKPTTKRTYSDEVVLAEGQLPFPLPTVTVVIPAKNEAKNLPFVLPRIPPWVHEVILIDGNSTDDTIQVAQDIWPSIRVVQQERKGKGAALRTGFAAATGDIVVMIDADGSMDPAEIPLFVGALMTGADFAKGSRFIQGGGTIDMELYRRLGNWGLLKIAQFFFGGNFSDLCYGYNAFWRWVLPQLELDGDGFEIETMINVRALKARLKIKEVPSFESERVHGVSNLKTIPDGWRVLKTIMKENFSPMPVVDDALRASLARESRSARSVGDA